MHTFKEVPPIRSCDKDCCKCKFPSCPTVINVKQQLKEPGCLVVLRDEDGETILAVFCSMRCAMRYHVELKQKMKQVASQSFKRFTTMQRSDVRIMRLLKDIHVSVEDLIRKSNAEDTRVLFS